MDLRSIEQVLADEAEAIHGDDWRALGQTATKQDTEERYKRLNADRRDGKDLPEAEVERRKKFYRSLNKLNRAALCLSGGGIRSATFCLGVLQAVAEYDAVHPHHTPSASRHPQTASPHSQTGAPLTAADSTTPEAKRDSKSETKAEDSLLGRIHYLSTVSGGGYIGSWLSSWRIRNDFGTIFANLTRRPDGPDVDPPEISWLRAYSNYLTPRVGIGSADSWAAVAIVVRNLALNWLIIIPLICLVLLGLKILVTIAVWAAHTVDNDSIAISLGVGVVLLVLAQAFTTRYRPALQQRRLPDSTESLQTIEVIDSTFLWRDLVWAVLSAIAVTVFFTSQRLWSPAAAGWWLDLGTKTNETALAVDAGWLDLGTKTKVTALAAAAGFVIFVGGWLWGWPPRGNWRDFFSWAFSGLIYGLLIGIGASFYSLLDAASLPRLLVPIVFGVPWVLMSQLCAETVFVGLVSYEAYSDSDREWLGRAAGWLAAVAVAWAILAFLVFAAGYYVQNAEDWISKAVVDAGGILGVISGLATAFLGSSSKTPARGNDDQQKDKTAFASNIALAVAGPVFAAVLIVALSVALDKALLGSSLIDLLQNNSLPPWCIAPFGKALIDLLQIEKPPVWCIPPLLCILPPLVIGSIIAGLIAWPASRVVNINRFSLHALYRNRLIRAYLGASRQKRHPDSFTGFDEEDNIRMHEIWPPKSGGGGDNRLFHVVNIALNLVLAKRLAWQQRKAESFTVSPLHCGNAYRGFRPSDKYGDGPEKGMAQGSALKPSGNTAAQKGADKSQEQRHFGISLGTAMAISGAAVSPNMGYHSSPSITLLLTLFNVRLGWWLGNPGTAGEKTYQYEGPKWAAKPLLDEAFGQTTDESPYVYLSDGGHFENLGLYEMVRRRCRFIIVVDAGCDPKFAFEDLGNAVRKIYIDLGVRITFADLQALKNRPPAEMIEDKIFGTDPARAKSPIPYHAIGTIHYKGADGSGDGCEDGCIVYIKPAYHGTETSAGIRSYATAHNEFPHESTADQWFTESQFESYRSLGLDIGRNVFKEWRNVRLCLDAFLVQRAASNRGAS